LISIHSFHTKIDLQDYSVLSSSVHCSPREENDPNDISKSRIALGHLECLLGFIDSDIKAKQTYLSSSSCSKVYFSDLWYLFGLGTEVVGRDGNQAYRVVRVKSPPHRVVPAWKSWFSDSKHEIAPFSITCVHIDFNGRSLGPVITQFGVKRFEGGRDITSLEVYPLRFHPIKKGDFNENEWGKVKSLPADGRYRQLLVNRGSKFLEVAEIKQMYYAGLTVDVREEVESQVVIDFETAFSVEDEKQQKWKPDIQRVAVPEQDSVLDTKACMAECCEYEIVHDDTYVDQKQATDYINGLLPKRQGMNELPSVAIIPQLLVDLRDGIQKNQYKISEDELAIMSYRVFGFVLRSRKWGMHYFF
jgi:uncharacterized protein DUF7025